MVIEHIQDDDDDDSFRRHWAERVWDRATLAQIGVIQDQLHHYAMTAWRSMNIVPPTGALLYCACEEGPVLMSVNELGDWRTSLGQPHKPPHAWMPAPPVPRVNGRGRP